MCLAIPGKVVSVDGDSLEVSYPGEIRKVTNAGLELSKGDYVLVQAKIAVVKLNKDEALRSLDAWKEAIDISEKKS